MEISVMLTLASQPEIDNLRRQYDVLFEKVPAHLTLIFPQDIFPRDLPIIKAFIDQTVTAITLPVSTVADYHADLPYHNLLARLNDPQQKLNRLHDALYQLPVFANAQRIDIPYQPHVTVGRDLSDQTLLSLTQQLNAAFSSIPVHFDRLILEEILADGQSKPLASWPI